MALSRLLVVAGEASGDAIAAQVVSRLREKLDLDVRGMGGASLEAVGGELLVDCRKTTAMGGVEVATRLPHLLAAFTKINAVARCWRPSAALLIDLPDFNMPLGYCLRQLGVPTCGLVAPQYWAWRYNRVKRMSRSFDLLACVLPFEENTLRRAGVNAHFVGHPAVEWRPFEKDGIRERLGIRKDAECLAILPGSRPAEHAMLLKPMIAAARRLRWQRPGLQLVLPIPATLSLPTCLPDWVIVVKSIDHPVPGRAALAAADAALVTSGSATLEAALAKTPQVVCYRLRYLSLIAAKLLVRTRFIALPNIILGRPAVPELLQNAVHEDALSVWASRLLDDGPEARVQRDMTGELRCRLRGPGASVKTASLLAELML